MIKIYAKKVTMFSHMYTYFTLQENSDNQF